MPMSNNYHLLLKTTDKGLKRTYQALTAQIKFDQLLSYGDERGRSQPAKNDLFPSLRDQQDLPLFFLYYGT